jgi:alkaline phosphatase D
VALRMRTPLASALLLLTMVTIGCQTGVKKTDASSSQLQGEVVAELKANGPIERIEFGSCAQPRQPQPIWSTMLAQNPDLYIGMGDNVYASSSEDRPVKKAYEMQAQIPEFKSFRARVPIIATWDDHDFGVNDGGSSNPEKNEYRAEFLKFFPNDAKVLGPNLGGIYHSFYLGQGEKSVHVILLDTRYYRSELEKQDHPKGPLDKFKPTKDKSKTFLGKDQWAWLENEFRRPSKVTILVSSVQLIHQEHGFEKWGNFPHERDRLLKLIGHSKKKNIIVISGDRHQGEIHQLKVKGYGNLIEITSSGINRLTNIASEPSTTRIGDRFTEANFGLISLNWSEKIVEAQLIGQSGKVANSLKIQLK